ncbi:MAG: hypothetical protein KC933_05830 [Myxococcales bacterium]|nr:hypothetical protein [Myxococcales bacterium]
MGKERLTFEIDGLEVSVSSPSKVYFPDAGITKLEVVEYFRAVAQPALRASGGRPIVLKRYVNGIAEEGFYQKRAPDPRPDWIETVTLRFPSGRRADEVVLRTEAQLVWAVNLGCLELHAHPVRADDVEHPDELRIDLDPVPGVEWAQVRDVGLVTREVLGELGLVGWPKTSGSRGLHIYARIHPRWGFTEVRRAALAVAREVERRAPGIATSRWWKEEREGVFLDYNQNAKDRTMAGAWSVRPRPDARVSMPLTWAELETVDPAQFTLRTAPARYREVGDPHAGMEAAAGDLGPVLALVEAHEAEGLGDAAWPPHYQKQVGEPVRAQPSRRRPVKPLVEIGRAKVEADAQEGLQRWKTRHPDVVPHLLPADVLVDKMRGRHSVWFRIRVNLEHVPEGLRPAQEALDPDYDVATEWAGVSAGAVELPQLPGVSDAKLWALHEALGITSVEELEEAARAGRVQTVKGFGAKTEAGILAAIERARVRNTRWLASEALAAVRPVQEGLSSVATDVALAGDLRRGVETVERAVLVVASASPDHKMSALRDGLQAALPILYAGIAVAVLALATGLVLGGLALVRARLQVKRPRPAAVFVGVALVLSALLIADAMPLAKEVSRPPPFSPRALLLPAALPVTTPDLEGALAEVPRGLVIVVGPQILQVEAAPIEGLHALPDRIRQAKQVDAMRSSARRPFSALLAVDRDTPVERVLEVIGVVGPAVDQLVLAFVHDEPQRARPIFGQRTLRTETWLRLSMTPGEPSVQVRAKERFQSLAERSIEAAGGGGAVHWRVSEEPPPGLEGRGAAAGHLRDTHP